MSFEEGVATLEVTAATEEDVGVYTCEATNVEGTTLHSATVFMAGICIYNVTILKSMYDQNYIFRY